MKNSKIFFLFIFTLLFIGSFSCKKEKKCAPIPDLPQDFLDYWFFPKDSWWVYQLKDSTLIDTLTVKNTYVDFKDISIEGPPECVKTYNIFLTHSADIYKDSSVIHFASWYGNDQLIGLGVSPDPLFAGLSGVPFFVYYPFELGDTIHYYKEDFILKNKDPLNTPYGNIIDVIHIVSISYVNNTIKEGSEIWFAKNIGIVKYIPPNKDKWELLDYKINK